MTPDSAPDLATAPTTVGPVPVLALTDLPDVGAVRVLVGEVAVAVVRDEAGEVHAVGDVCTHADVSLSEGDVADCAIECWLHGSQFDLRTGRPLSLPAIKPIPVYPVTIQAGQVYVDVTPPVGDADVATTTVKES
jgi:3-phenylpropionate/trans-cinnamate dioxygenase ferredoxin subunit